MSIISTVGRQVIPSLNISTLGSSELHHPCLRLLNVFLANAVRVPQPDHPIVLRLMRLSTVIRVVTLHRVLARKFLQAVGGEAEVVVRRVRA